MEADERLRIDTPEQVALELPVAGIGSRFLAVAVDTVLQVALVAATALVVSLAPAVASQLGFLVILGPVVAILVAFCVYWGYFAVFEALWSGRTPGKQLAGIRVIKESGRPINAFEAIARNVLRAVDFLPAFYGLGVVVMMLNRNSRRLGDYVAGTVVVHDRRTEALRPGLAVAGDLAGGGENLSRMTAEELTLIESYLRRRLELDPGLREQMGEQIARRIAERTGLNREGNQPLDEFLEAVARRIRDTARFR